MDGVVGAFFAIIVVKQLFGGLGQNFMNPALGARCFLLICFAGKMTNFVYDGVTGPTLLANLKAGESVDSFAMLIGNTSGTIGETSVIALMIGAMFLILMGVIDLRIPGTYILTFVILFLYLAVMDLTHSTLLHTYAVADSCSVHGLWQQIMSLLRSPVRERSSMVSALDV